VSGHPGTPERHPSLDERFDPAVRLVAYTPTWALEARRELRRIGETLGSVAIRLEHVGSTAVPGMAAKPILDLQLSVADIAAQGLYVQPLEGLGYVFIPDPDSPDYHFFAKRSYETLKRALVDRFPQDRLAYIAGKERHLGELQALALEWAKHQ
jgi:GrpB-like predicted nucleotidyltransferase (UPF0157 family)